MRRLLAIACGVLLSWVGLNAQTGKPFLVAPSMLYYTDQGDTLVPIWIQNKTGGAVKTSLEIYDVYGNLVWDSLADINLDSVARWYGTTNGGRRVQSGQYMLIIKVLESAGFENAQQREWIGVVW